MNKKELEEENQELKEKIKLLEDIISHMKREYRTAKAIEEGNVFKIHEPNKTRIYNANTGDFLMEI